MLAGNAMQRELMRALIAGAFVATSSAAMAHHSAAMFDQENPIELVGTVKEFKFTNPHTFVLLEVKDSDGSVTVWTLEGGTPISRIRRPAAMAPIRPIPACPPACRGK